MTVPKIELTGETILLVVAAIVVVAEVISAIAKGKKSYNELSGRDQRQAEMLALKQRVGDLEAWKIQTDHRLQQGNIRFDENSKDTMEILLVLRSMIKHMQSGNDHAKLQETDDKLYKYLVEKRGVSPSTLD